MSLHEFFSSTFSTLRLGGRRAGAAKANEAENLRGWSRKEVRRMFRRQGLGDYVPALRQAKADGSRLLAMHHAGTLYDALAMTKLSHKKRLRSAIRRLATGSIVDPTGCYGDDEDDVGQTSLPRRAGKLKFRMTGADKNEAAQRKNECDAKAKTTKNEEDEKAKRYPSETVTPRNRQRPPLLDVDAPLRVSRIVFQETCCPPPVPRSVSGSHSPRGWSSLSTSSCESLASTITSEAKVSLCSTIAYYALFGQLAVKLEYGEDVSVLMLPRRGSDSEDEVDIDDVDDLSFGETEQEYAHETEKEKERSGTCLLRVDDLRRGIKETYGKDMRVHYLDQDDDLVSIETDDSLNYAFRDWCNSVRRTNGASATKSWRLILHDVRWASGYYHECCSAVDPKPSLPSP